MAFSTIHLVDICYIDAGTDHSLAIDKYGNVWVWGRNQYDKLGLGEQDPGYIGYEKTPKLMPKTK